MLSFFSLVNIQKLIGLERWIQLESLTTITGKIIPSTNSPVQLMQPTIRKADGLNDWLKISTITDTVAPAEKQNTNQVEVVHRIIEWEGLKGPLETIYPSPTC